LEKKHPWRETVAPCQLPGVAVHAPPAEARNRNRNMSNPVVLITGALTGIGRATALAFAKDGAHVVASGRREAEGKELETELRNLGAEAAFIRADVRHEDDVRSLIDQTVTRFGRIDAAVNAAGTEGQPGPVVDQSP